MNTKTLTALAEPNRLRIVELLSAQPLSVNDVAAKLQIRQPQASKHLRTLHDAGVIRVQPVAQKRMYSIEPKAFTELEQWLKALETHWAKQLDRLGNILTK